MFNGWVLVFATFCVFEISGSLFESLSKLSFKESFEKIFSSAETILSKIPNRSIEETSIGERDPYRTHEIYDSLESAPATIIDIMGDYEYEDTIFYFHNRVMNRLDIPKEKRWAFDFYNEDFANRLYLVLSKKEILHQDLFWKDLARLLFKLMISTIKRTDIDGERVFKDIEKLAKLIHKNSWLHHFPSNFDLRSMNNDAFKFFEELVRYEVLEDFDELFSEFSSAIAILYSEGMNCPKSKIIKSFIKKLNDNWMVKSIIFFFGPMKRMNSCGMFKGNYSKVSNHEPKISKIDQIPNYLESLKLKLIKPSNSFNIEFASPKIIRDFISKGISIPINSSASLVVLIKKIKEGKLLKLNPSLIKLIDFGFNNQKSPIWKRTFSTYLFEQMNNKFISSDEYYDYLSIISSPNEASE